MDKGYKLQTIVIMFVFGTVLFALLIAGYSINRVLTTLYDDKASLQLTNANRLFNKNLRHIETDILSSNKRIASNDIVRATAHLVNRYESSSNYQSLIFDNDKKKIAKELLARMHGSHSGFAALFGTNGKLISFAHKNDASHAGISSFIAGKRRYLVSDDANRWNKGKIPSAYMKIVTKYLTEKPVGRKDVTYKTHDDGLLLLNRQPVERLLHGGGREVLGYVVYTVLLDNKFFRKISSESATHFSLVRNGQDVAERFSGEITINQIASFSRDLGVESYKELQLLPHKEMYVESYKLPVVNDKAYLVISQGKTELATALNQTRTSLMIVFVITAILAMFSGVFFLNRFIVKPVSRLVDGAMIDDRKRFPVFPTRFLSKEISQLGKVLNSMVKEIKVRSKALESSERQLKHSQKMARLGGWRLDHVENRLEWSEDTYKIFDVDPKRFKPSYTTFLDCVHPEDEEYVDNVFTDAIVNQKSYDITHRILCRNGTTRYIREFCETDYNESGSPIESIGAVQDVTEQAIKDEQLRRSQKMDALDKLTGGIAHDFNNSLSIILGFAELLKYESSKNSINAEYIEDIIHAGERAKNLTAKLMSFARKEVSSAGKMNINQLLLDEYRMLQKTLTVRVRLKLDLENELWPVWIDKDELEDAVVNMCINSMHAMPGGGDLILSTKNVSLGILDVLTLDIVPGDYILIGITDTGTGMDKETVQRIFEPFYTTKKEKGTGLGMSQVYGFVKRSKGSITIYSDKDSGTRINIYLPRLIGNGNDIQSRHRERQDFKNLAGHETILVVDDEYSLQELSSKILSSHGYTVYSTGNAREALEFLKDNTVDLVLSDVIMPGMSGYELASEIRKLYPHIKLQMVSGYADETDNNYVSDVLHRQRLQKPFTSKVLLQCVRTILDTDNIADVSSA